MKTAHVTITRPQGSRSGESSIAITIEDDDSSLTVLRVEMTLADFAACVTGHGHMPAKVEYWIGKHASNVGKTLEVRTLKLSGRDGCSRLILTSITASEITAGFAHYRFGSGAEPTVELMTQIMANALLSINAGMRAGGTLTMIMRDLGLVGVRSGKLTKRGREFLFDCFDRATPSYPVFCPTESRQAPVNGQREQVGGNAVLPRQAIT